MVRVGRTVTRVCGNAGTSVGSAPAMRYGLPSMRTRLRSVWGRPVQCLVSASVRASLNDQTLRYGSHVTSGTAGGRSAGRGAALVRDAQDNSAPVRSANVKIPRLMVLVS